MPQSSRILVVFLRQRFNMSEAKPVGSTLPTNCKLSGKLSPKTKAKKAEMMKIPYASTVGSLMYAMVCTRPDIGYAIGVVSRFMSNPGKEHWNAVKWILRYLKGTSKCASDSAQVNPNLMASSIRICRLMWIPAGLHPGM